MADLNKPQKIFMSILYCLTAIASLILVYVIYNIAEKEKPQTLGTVYADSLSKSEEDINIIEVKIHSNENNNGQACYEVLYNGYTDYQGGAIKGFGIQKTNLRDNRNIYFTDLQGNKVLVTGHDSQMYYTDDLGTSTYVTNDMPNELYIDINGSFYKIQFDSYQREVYSKKGWDAWNIFWNIKTTENVSYNFYSLSDFILNSAASNSAKHENGEYTISLLDCSKYIKVLYQDKDTQYKPLDKTSTMYEFLKIHVTYSKDGMTNASQSLFHQYYGNASWSFFNDTEVEDYWNAYANIELTESNINYVYNNEKSSYYATIDEEFAQYLSTLTKADIKVSLDFNDLDFDVYGIDLSNFSFDINSFEIITEYGSDLTIYNSDKCETQPVLKVV